TLSSSQVVETPGRYHAVRSLPVMEFGMVARQGADANPGASICRRVLKWAGLAGNGLSSERR
ncbi:MAG: hypothetical protein ACK5WR_01085, partial [Planctomycetaceae bacterium]